MEGGVYARIVPLCHYIPSISPHPSGFPGSVWDLPWDMWVMFATALDARLKEAAHG